MDYSRSPLLCKKPHSVVIGGCERLVHEGSMDKITKSFEREVVVGLLAMMIFTVPASTVELTLCSLANC